MKRCSKCGEAKAAESFYRDAHSRDGLQSWCKACRKAYIAENREQVSAYHAAYYAAQPDKCKAASRAWREAHREHCNAKARECARVNPAARAARDARWYAKHREQGRASAKAWRMAHKEQCREYYKQYRDRQRSQSPITDVTLAGWRNLVALWGGQCAYCGDIPVRMSRDHVRPLTRGGLNMMSNLLPACRACNSSKHNRLLSEWPRYQRMIQGVVNA